ncbi:CHAP domain-containing protein [Streptosporangium sp. NPDC049644]|uniref:CHAP domain-containing protein n=1 Tax=Streptosporangium sp. NPDC049644 TaxID=3155507 RepID=UPI00342DFD2A
MQKFIKLLESQLGYSEKSGGYTKFGDWYGRTVEFDADYTAAPWCDMYLSWAAAKLGYEEWIGQFAYTVYHARWFRQQDAWGTTPKPGAIVFFDWNGSKRIDGIDHVGIVTRVEGNRIHTIEGNIDGGIAKRKERDTGKVVGYGYPEKIKARLDREATEKQMVLDPAAAAATASGGGGGNLVAIDPGPDLLDLVPAPVPARKTPASAGPGKTGQTPGHATGPIAGNGRESTSGSRGETASGNDGRTVSGNGDGAAASRQSGTANTSDGDRAAAGTPGQARPRTSPGKHAKPATADTSALAVSPTATVRDLTVHPPELGSPAVLAPVLLAAAAIIAHARAKQSRVRLAPAAGRTAPVTPSRRAPGRRRASGRTGTPARTGTAGRSSAPYRGRRRSRERPVVESSTFVQDAPLRGRRHRRADSVITTTIPATPAHSARPARSTMPAHLATGPRTATVSASLPVTRGARTGQSGPATLAGPLTSPAEPGDVLVHSGYRGRRRRTGVPA